MHNSRSEQQGGDAARKKMKAWKPPSFCLLRAKRQVAAVAFLRVSGNRVSFGQSGSILDKLVFVLRPLHPLHLSPRCLCLFWCAFGLFIRSRANCLSRLARLRNMNRVGNLDSAHTKHHPQNLGRTVKVASSRSTST